MGCVDSIYFGEYDNSVWCEIFGHNLATIFLWVTIEDFKGGWFPSQS